MNARKSAHAAPGSYACVMRKLLGAVAISGLVGGAFLLGNDTIEVLGGAGNTVRTLVNATLTVRFPCGTAVVK